MIRTTACLTLAALFATGCAAGPGPDTGRVFALPFGKARDGDTIRVFTLINNGMTAKVINYGAILTELHVPDRHGQAGDVVLGFDKFTDYETKNTYYFGATIGRYANRIAGGTFVLDLNKYRLTLNDGVNAHHGGRRGFDKRRWDAEMIAGVDGPAVRMTLVSDDRDQGFPGRLEATVTYTLTSDGLRIDYTAVTDRPTVVNLTNHTYWNLSAKPGEQTVLSHTAQIDADRYTAVDRNLIPTGELPAVDGTPFDFRTPVPIGQRNRQTGRQGYDHNFALNGGVTGSPRRVATIADPGSGRIMDVETTEPGLQLFDANTFDGQTVGKRDTRYGRHAGLTLKTQHFPDSPNHPDFPSTVLRPSQTYRSTTIYRFRTDKPAAATRPAVPDNAK